MINTRLMVSLAILLISGGIGLAQDVEDDDVAGGATDLGSIGAEGGEISYETDLAYPGDIDWFKFTVEGPTADLVVSSDLSYMRLIAYDTDMGYLDDDRELLKLTLGAGTYFIRADSIYSETENYTINVSTINAESEPNDCISDGNDLGLLTNTTMIYGSIDPMADTDFFFFEVEPESEGYISISGDPFLLEEDEEDDWWYYPDDLSLVLYSYNESEGRYLPIEDGLYDIETYLSAGKYAVRAQSEYADSTLGYVLVISFLSSECDDEPNDAFEEAADLGVLAEGAELAATGCILPEEDEDYYIFQVDETREVVIETSGEDDGDSYLYLYDEDEEMIDYNDDDGEGSWSMIEEELEAGTYYILVESYYGGDTFEYTLTVEG